MYLSEIIDFFNENAGFIQALFSFLIFSVTVIYVIINSLMHVEMKKTREMSESPEISIRLEKIKSGFYNIVIENISDVPVYELHFLKYPSLQTYGDKTSEDIGFLRYGIRYMAPHQSYESFFLNYPSINDKLQTIEFHIEYKNKNNKIFNQNFEINLSLFYNKSSLGKSFNEELLEELTEIKKSINSLKEKN